MRRQKSISNVAYVKGQALMVTHLLNEAEQLAKIVGVLLVQGADLADVFVLRLEALNIIWWQ
jgi:hypothetical protein